MRFAYVVGVLTLLSCVLTWISTDHFRGFGAGPDEAELVRFGQSSHFREGHFENLEHTEVSPGGKWMQMLRRQLFGDEMRTPNCELPLFPTTKARLWTAPTSGLRITWLGHSTTLIEIDGVRILTDPIWSEHSSPSYWVGPTRFHPPPVAIRDLPHLDAVIISHEHFDHLDMATVRSLARNGVVFHVPLGVGSHLRSWDVPPAQIHEHDWWDGDEVARGVRVISTPSRHFNGRGVPGRTGTFWTSWSVVGPRHRVFFSGDTGFTEAFRDIGQRFGPFDVAMFEIGQYDRLWGEIHLGPEGALEAHRLLGARVFLPIHWATFQLGFHAWSEPAETLLRHAEQSHIDVLTPLLGEPIEPTEHPTTRAWWRDLPPMTDACPSR